MEGKRYDSVKDRYVHVHKYSHSLKYVRKKLQIAGVHGSVYLTPDLYILVDSVYITNRDA